MRKIKPLKNRILLKELNQSKTTKFGIVIPNTAITNKFDMPDRGKIMAMGKTVDKNEFSIGDKVFFNRVDPLRVTLSGEDTEDGSEIRYLLIKDDEILGKIDD